MIEGIWKEAKYKSSSMKKELRKMLPRRSVPGLGKQKLHLGLV